MNIWVTCCPFQDKHGIYNALCFALIGRNWWSPRRIVFTPPNGREDLIVSRPEQTITIVFNRRWRFRVVNMLFSSIVNQRTLPMLSCLLFPIHLLGCVSQLSIEGGCTGNVAQLCSVWPLTMLAATPDIAIFASSTEVFWFLNDFKITFSSADFPIPPWPWTSVKKKVR